MWKSIFYKEWLKTRWVFFISTAISLLAIVFILLQVRANITHASANFVWYKILFFNDKYYNLYMYIPFISGVALAFFQFLPEVQHKRLKLTYHLPLQIHNSLFLMIVFGMLINSLSFFISIVAFKIIASLYFPINIIIPTIYSIIPWAVNGGIAYAIITNVLLEPTWRQRTFLLIIGGLSIIIPFQKSMMMSLNPLLFILILLYIIWLSATFYSGYRFGKMN